MSETVPPQLPAIADARLPASYESARKALAECSQIDECKEWSDKAAALASYARQAKESTLHNLALRIQARATRRYGELLKQIPRGDEATRFGRDGGDPPGQVGAHPPVTRTQAATQAGLSERQRKTGLRVANVPRDEFEAAVESETPPTVSELAIRGTASHPQSLAPGPPPADLALVSRAQSLLCELAAFCGAYEPVSIAHAPGADADLLRGYVATIDRWLDRFVTNLRAEDAAA